MDGRIFINYRREISADAAGRLADRLSQHFGDQRVFMDVDGIEPGVDFVKALDDQVAQCGAFIAVIGRDWADFKNAEGQRRLDQPNDYVRIEIELALKRDIRVIPVLVDGARMPTAKELPDSLEPFSRRNAVTLSHQRFGSEVDELAGALQRALGLQPKPTTPYAFAPSFAAKETPTPSWIDYLFSFEGRISRKSFWISSVAILAVCLLIQGAVGAVLGENPFGTQPVSSKVISLYDIAVLPIYWPSCALYLKRLHDFGQGLGGFWPPMVGVVLAYGLQFAGYDEASAIVAIAVGGLLLIIGCIKGTPGPNQYGPDPLAKIARKSAT